MLLNSVSTSWDCGMVQVMAQILRLGPSHEVHGVTRPSNAELTGPVVGTDIASGCWPRCSRSAQCGRLLGSGKCFHHRTSRTTCCTSGKLQTTALNRWPNLSGKIHESFWLNNT
jgi:hypothetical protein